MFSTDKSIAELHEDTSTTRPPHAANDTLDESHRSESLPVLNRARSETPGSEKIQLLRRQMEQNRAKMAEREHSKRDIEQLVTQLKAKFDSSQMSLDRSQQLGRSIGDLSATASPHAHNKYQSASDLSVHNTFDKDRIRYLEQRLADVETELQRKESEFLGRDAHQELQHRILDLQEQLREKDSLIEARTQAVGLLSENLSLRGKNTVDLLEDTQQEMHQMQTRFVDAEDAYRAELDQKAMRIANLEQMNDILETARFDLTVQMAQHSGGAGVDTRLVELQKLNETLQRKIEDLEAERPVEESLGKVDELQKLNETLQRKINDLEAERPVDVGLQHLNETLQRKKDDLEAERPSEQSIDQLNELKSQINDLQQRLLDAEQANNQLSLQILQIEQLHVENDDLKRSLQTTTEPITNDDLTDRIRSLEGQLADLRAHNESLVATNATLDAQLHEKTVDHNVLAANFSVLQEKLKSSAPKSLFSVSTDEEAEAEVAKLKAQLDDANKAAIKTKLKTKQLQKQIDALKKSSDLAAQVCQLTQDNQMLQQRIADHQEAAAAATAVPSDTALGQRIQVLETTCHNQISAIRLLEEQKIDISQDLSVAKDELHSLQDHCKSIADDHEETARVQCHMDAIEQEETIDTYRATIAALRTEVAVLRAERAELAQKLQDNVAENMELLERWDKVNKGSSAESIEIVEKLTPQETLEMEAMQRATGVESDRDVIGQDLNDSLVQLREESNELMVKIEMFTKERCEVLDKMEVLSAENQRLTEQVEQLIQDRASVEQDRKEREEHLQTELATVHTEQSELRATIGELQTAKLRLREELNIVTKCRAESSTEPLHHDRDTYDKAIKSLESLLEGYRRGKDKNAKFDVSKKLAKESKNLVDLMTALLTEHGQTVERVNALQTESSQATRIDALRDNEHTDRIESKLAEATQTIRRLETECSAQKEEVARLLRQIDENAEDSSEVAELQDLVETLQTENDTLFDAIVRKNAQTEQHIKAINALDLLVRQTAQKQVEVNRNIESAIASSRHTKHLAKIDQNHEMIGQLIERLAEQRDAQRREFDGRLDAAAQERQILQALVDEQKAQLIQTLDEHQLQLDQRDQYVEQLGHKMVALKKLFDDNNDRLEQQAVELAHNQQTIGTLNAQITELYQSAEEHASRQLEKDDEIGFLQEIIERNRAEAVALGARVKGLETQIDQSNRVVAEKEKAIRALSDKTASSGETAEKVAELQQLVDGLEARNKEQLEKLKKFAANLKKKNVQCSELTEKVHALEAQINGQQLASSLPVAADDPARAELVADLEHKATSIAELQTTIAELTQQLSTESTVKRDLQHITVDLTDRITALSNELTSLKSQNESLHQQNISYAHNLQHAQQTIDSQNVELTSKVRHNAQLLVTFEQRSAELASLQQLHQAESDELAANKLKIEKCKAIIREKNREIKRLQEAVDELNAKYDSSPAEAQKSQQLVTELSAVQRERDEAHAAHQQHSNAFQLKLQEHVNYIESLQAEAQTLRDKISQLEEVIGGSAERHVQLEHQLAHANTQLASSSAEFQSHKDEWQRQINAATAEQTDSHQRIQVAQQQRQELHDQLQEATRSADEAHHKYAALEHQLGELNQRLVDADDDKSTLLRDNTQLQSDLKSQLAEFDRKLAEKRQEVDTLENDLTVQLERIEDERRRLHEALDKSVDENGELQSDIVRLKEIITSLELSNSDLEREMTWIKMQNEGMQQDQVEVQELRMQIVHDQTELENLKSQAQTMAQNHETEVTALKQQLAELDSLRTQIGQNQTDDQMFIENENERLQTLLASKEVEIQNYQRQNLQLQMTGAFGRASQVQADPFAVLSPAGGDDFARLTETSSDSEKLQRIEELESQLQRTIDELKHLKSQHDEFVQQTDAEKQQFEQASARHVEHQAAELVALRHQSEMAIAAKDDEIATLREIIERIERESRVVDEPIVVSTAAKECLAQPDNTTTAPPTAEDASTVQEVDQLRRNTSHLEQYINDLQIQLRIATNDCEQLTQMQQTLEDEIQQRSRGYEEKISSLRQQLKKPPVDRSIFESVESQIIPNAASAPSARLPSFDGAMFFGQTTASKFDLSDGFTVSTGTASEPQEVVEEVIVPKTTYQCVEETVEADDDGWGFSAAEAVLEEQHQQLSVPTATASLLTAQGALELQLQEQEDRLQELSRERDRLRTENQALLAKSGKMLKKLKEYKAKNDELTTSVGHQHFSKSPSVESNELDLAIQAELNTQIQSLEARVAAAKAQYDKDQLERQNLVRRVDVLTAANDRLTEMKEQQDAEMDVVRSKGRQLSEQLAQIAERGPANAQNAPSDGVETYGLATEYQRQLADLQVDYDELQAILNEEKEQRAALLVKWNDAQNSIRTVHAVQADLERYSGKMMEYNRENKQLLQEMALKNETIQELELRTAQLTARMNESVATIDTLSVESNNIRVHLEQLKLDHQVKIDENSSLSQQLKAFSDHIKELQHSMSEVPRSSPPPGVTPTDDTVAELEQQVVDLQSELQCKAAEIVHLNQSVADAAAQDQTASLVQEILAKNTEMNGLRTQIAEQQEQIVELQTNVSVQLTQSLASTNSEDNLVKQLQDEVRSLLTDHQHMEQELAVLNDQVIGSLQLEDQLEAMRLQVERKSLEISELKSALAQSSTAVGSETPNGESAEECTKRLNAHWEQVLNDRCAEVADSWRQHMDERELAFESELQKLTSGEAATKATTESSAVAQPPSEPTNDELQSMRSVLESQELEIVTLKEQLAIRSAEYARIAARVDPFGQMSTASSSGTRRDAEPRSNQKSELDLALYMLHQRDMRCEELTEELMSMLEERDSLQAKLATSIRQLEHVRQGGVLEGE